MAANYGFVYVLRNDCMPGIYKIGMTDRSPCQRRDELSSATSVPLPFDLVCYAEVEDARALESHLHDCFSNFRINPSREFFALSGEGVRSLFFSLEENSNFIAYGDIAFLAEDARDVVVKKGGGGSVALENLADLEALPSKKNSRLWRVLCDMGARGE